MADPKMMTQISSKPGFLSCFVRQPFGGRGSVVAGAIPASTSQLTIRFALLISIPLLDSFVDRLLTSAAQA